DDHTIKTWDLRSGRLLRTVPFGVEAPPAKGVPQKAGDGFKVFDTTTSFLPGAFGPDGRLFAAAMPEKPGSYPVRIWDTISGAELQVLRGHKNTPDAVSFSPDGRRLATGSSDNTLRVWDVAT